MYQSQIGKCVLLIAVVLSVNCGELAKVNTDGGNCDLSSVKVCLDFPDTVTDGTAKTDQCVALQAALSSSGYNYTAGTGNDCSTASRLGSCTVSTGVLRYYSGGSWDATSAATDCTGSRSGTWTAN